jgi:hypothetical protein
LQVVRLRERFWALQLLVLGPFLVRLQVALQWRLPRSLLIQLLEWSTGFLVQITQCPRKLLNMH